MTSHSHRPLLLMVAGPRGAGKSSYIRHYISGLPIVNGQEIMYLAESERLDLSQERKELGRKALQAQEDCLARGTSFVFETMLSSRADTALLQKARDRGFLVVLHYFGVESPDLCVHRADHRAKLGICPLSVRDIHQHYWRSLEQLASVVSSIEKAVIFDNSGRLLQQACVYMYGHCKHIIRKQPRWLEHVMGHESRIRQRKVRI